MKFTNFLLDIQMMFSSNASAHDKALYATNRGHTDKPYKPSGQVVPPEHYDDPVVERRDAVL